MSEEPSGRGRQGVHQVALRVSGEEEWETVTAKAWEQGWRLVLVDRHSFTGGPGHRAAGPEEGEGFAGELVTVAAPPDTGVHS
ncbi:MULTISPECIES: VOC family protein [Streptomyces]|uniref:Uncharacterized protein n=1 Tax=Streptomyces rutgersensis TaxID=53451 RepID=A0ABX6RL21_9ACTN|nr:MULTISPECIES: hypothetical protein [Streptomyces]QNE80928.1 hypothetical protein F0345_07185 [Streptomyces rutgersensis]